MNMVCETKRYVVGITIFMLTLTSQAAITCTGPVRTLAIGPASGYLQVDAGYGVHYLCRFDAIANGVDPATCKAWYSLFLMARATGKNVNQSYQGTTATSCAQLGSWRVPVEMPYWIDLAQ